MNIRTRLTIVATCLALCVPASGVLVGRLDRTERDRARETLTRTLAFAATEFRSGMNVQADGDRAKRDMRKESRRLSRLRQRQIEVRERLIHLKNAESTLAARYGSGTFVTASGVTLRDQKTALEAVMARAVSLSIAAFASDPVAGALHLSSIASDAELLGFVSRTMSTAYEGRFQRQMLEKSRAEALAERQSLKVQIADAEQRYAVASATYMQSLAALDDIKATVQEVRGQILALQSELTAIDEKLRRHAARALIEKGLLEPGELPTGRAAAPVFGWPVVGRVTAGFHEESYVDHFGVPHEAIDIAADQNTPVLSAADGIVFLARDGGEYGYSYLLIGHQGGFATLYGHLSQFTVAAGDQVTAGQVVGLSGGTPGTHGAGPMTTGPHLHFELIQDGEHIDPRVVLP